MAFRNEAFSFFTHLGGGLVGVLGAVLLVGRAHGSLAVGAFSVYGATLVLMFGSSTLHHVRHAEGGLFRKLDMTAVYLFIAGSYTPTCLLALPPRWGVPIISVIWALALVGVAMLWLAPATPRKVTAAFYLGLGWLALVGVYPLAIYVGWGAVAYLVAGGLVYSVGAIVYARKRPDPWPAFVGYHGLWHVFVLVAAALHFALVWRYVPPG